MAKRNHIARICARLNSGSDIVASDVTVYPEKCKVLTAVERVLAIRAKKIAELRRQLFVEDEAGKAIAYLPPMLKSRVAAPRLPRNIFKVNRHRARKERQPEKEVVLNGQSNFSSTEPMRPRISLKGLDVYVRSRVGGREEPGRRFARNKELRKGGRISLRKMPLLDPDFHEFDDNEFELYCLSAEALLNAYDECVVMVR